MIELKHHRWFLFAFGGRLPRHMYVIKPLVSRRTGWQDWRKVF